MENTTPPTPPPPPPPPGNEPPFQRPADYYEAAPAAETPAQKKGCPKWIPIGCGGGGCLLILLLIGGAFWAFRDGGGTFIGRLLGPLQGQVTEMVDADVTDDQKATFDLEMTRLREGLKDGSVNIVAVQPIIQQMQSATSDRRITSDELDEINEMLLGANDSETSDVPPAPDATDDQVPEGSTEL